MDRSATRPWGLASRGGVFGERSLDCQRAWQQKAAHGSQTCFPTLPCRKSSSLLGTSCRGGGARQSAARCAAAGRDARGLDRKCGVSGKSVSVRVGIGGRGILKKKNI